MVCFKVFLIQRKLLLIWIYEINKRFSQIRNIVYFTSVTNTRMLFIYLLTYLFINNALAYEFSDIFVHNDFPRLQVPVLEFVLHRHGFGTCLI